MTIPLVFSQLQTSDSTVIDDHKARFGDPSTMYAALNSYDHVASGTTDLLGIDIKVTGFDGEAGNNKDIQVIVDTSREDQTSFVGNTLTVLLSNDLTTTDGTGVVSHNYKISDIATLINSDADFSATFSGVDANVTALPAVTTKDGTSDQISSMELHSETEI